MLENIFILLEILAVVFAGKAYQGFASQDLQHKASIFWVLSAVLFGILAMASYGIEVTLDTSILAVSQTPLAWLNWGFMGIVMLMFFADTFDNGF